MTRGNIKNRRYEDREAPGNAPALILAAIAIFGVSVLLMYIAIAEPQSGTAMGAIRDVMRGLGGSLCFALPLVLAWSGVLCIFAARGRRVSAIKTAVDILLVLTFFAGVHVFFARRIVVERMTIAGFSNFVAKSYSYGQGGGAVGALLAWPLYRYAGEAGGFIAALLIMLLCLTATGRLARLAGFISDRAEARAQAVPKKIEHKFDEFEATPPRRRGNVNRDPFSEDVLTGRNGGAQSRQRPAQPRAPRARANAPQREAVAGVPRKRRPEAAPAEPIAQTPEKPTQTRRKSPAKRKKLYIEEVKQAPEQAPAEAAEAAPTPPEDIDFFDDYDDFEPMDAQDILKDADDSRRKFKPDRPSAAEPVDLPEPEEALAPEDAHLNDDLKIEPEQYETPDDDAPFDIPSRQRVKKEDLPKIRREEMKVEMDEDAPEYNYPPIDLLEMGEAEDVSKHSRRDREKGQNLVDTLRSFGIETTLTGIAHGPAVTRFEVQPAAGIKVSRITSLSDDIAMNLEAMSVRIEAPIPGKKAVGVEIPNDKVEMVRLRDVLESQEARKHPSRIAVGLGKDNSGRYIVADIAKMPHVLIAGQTGSGKSVCINSIIASILFRASPEEVRLILIDPKVVELSIYNDIPHLVCPVVTDPKKAASALDWAVAEMTKRYRMFAEKGVRDIKGYNKALDEGEKAMPQMVIIIDELADLMMVSPGEVEDSICRIAQLARACGMHLVIATQRPSVNVITGIIKANIPTRIAFSVASQVDSRTMIDHGGAEKLLGNGDMLFVPNGGKSMRVQGAWVSDEEVHAIVEYIKQGGTAEYDPDMIEHMENAARSDAENEDFTKEYDPRLPEAIDIVLELGQASISMLQRRMRIGYAKAGRLIDQMAQRGIVSEADGSKPRTVLMTREQIDEMFEEE